MEKLLNIGNKEIVLKFNDGANCWQSNLNIGGVNIELEIDFFFHKDSEVDWDHFIGFFKHIDQNDRLKKIVTDSKQLALEVGKAFYRECYEEISDYKMEFSNSIIYKGKTDGNYIKDGYSYSLVFNYWTKRDNGIFGDEYGIYLVEVENHFIVGARRHQC